MDGAKRKNYANAHSGSADKGRKAQGTLLRPLVDRPDELLGMRWPRGVGSIQDI